MEVILKKQVKGLGKPGELVKVSDGYARNFLLPKKLAVPATVDNRKAIENRAKDEAKKKERQHRKRQELVERIENLTCSIQKQVSEDNRIFGSVSQVDVLKCLKENDIDLEKKQILLDKPIKSLGVHPVKIRLGKGLEAVLKIWIEKKNGS